MTDSNNDSKLTVFTNIRTKYREWKNGSTEARFSDLFKYRKSARVDPLLPTTFHPTTYEELVKRKIELQNKRNEFWYYDAAPNGLCAVSGVTIYRMVRRSVKLYEGATFGALLTAFLSASFNHVSNTLFVEESQYKGSNCVMCSVLKSVSSEVFAGILVPSVFSAALVGILSERYSTGHVVKGDFKAYRRFWFDQYKVIYRRILPLFLFNVILTSYCAIERFRIIDNAKRAITKKEYDEYKQQLFATIKIFKK